MGSPAESSTPSRSSTTPAGRHVLAGGVAGGRESSPSRAAARASPPMRSPGWSGIAPVAIDEHGAKPAARWRPRCRRPRCRPPSRPRRPVRRRGRARRRRSSRTACACRAHARRARSPRRCRAAPRTASSSRSVFETRPDRAARSPAGPRAAASTSGKSSKLLGSPHSSLGRGRRSPRPRRCRRPSRARSRSRSRRCCALRCSSVSTRQMCRASSAGLLVAVRDRAARRSGHRAPCSRGRRTPGADGST